MSYTWPNRASPAAAANAMRLAALPRLELALLLASIAGVVAIRLQLLVATDFPINDGALFLVFVETIARTFPALPALVEYNGLSIPFAYPPLSFWLSAAAVKLGADPLWIVHRVPILMNIAYVLLFALLLLRTGHSRLFVAIAVLVFGTSFRSYEWLVMGGGLSRGLGGLFLLLSLALLLQRRDQPAAPLPLPRLIAGGMAVGAAVLSHLEWGILAAFSALVCLALSSSAIRSYLQASLTVGLTALAVAAPWLWTVYQTHGLQPFLNASGTGFGGPGLVHSAVLQIVRSSNFLLPFVLLGAVAAIRTRDVIWVIFLAAALLLTPRHGATPMVLSLGVLAAGGVLTSFMLLERWAAGRRWAFVALASLVVALGALRTSDALQRNDDFTVLPAELRDAMTWVARTHPGATFSVINGSPWPYNGAAEWFPVLARAASTTTVQGREWLPNREFQRVESAVEALDTSTSCEQLMANLGAFPPADFHWVQAVDLQARAALLERAARRSRSLRDRIQETIERRLSGAGAGDRGAAGSALAGSGTAAGCFEAARYDEVYSNGRVRIFRAR